MAGHGSRFVAAGFKDPKPMILVNGKPMIQVVIDNLRPSCPHRFIFICQAEHLENYALRQLLESLAPGCELIALDEVTQGAACTVLLASHIIDNDDRLMIANCDQYIAADIDDYLAVMDDPTVDGVILTMKAHDKKWSFIKLDDRGWTTLVVEKEVVSDEATVGIYCYRRGSDFVRAAQAMVARNLRVNNEFYVAPAYNEMIADGRKISAFNIGRVGVGMHGLGTPEDLADFHSRTSAPLGLSHKSD